MSVRERAKQRERAEIRIFMRDNQTELKWYNVRYRHMSDERQRKLFEAYVIGTLKPKYNFN